MLIINSTRDVWKFAKLDSPRWLVQFWQNFQTSLVLLIPNCTRHRMITYTNRTMNISVCIGNSRLSSAIWKKKTCTSVCFSKLHEKPYYYLLINNNVHEKIMQSLLKLLNVWGFLLFLLEIAVSYWLSLLLFHILSQSETLNSQ